MDKVVCDNVDGATIDSERLHDKDSEKTERSRRRRNSLSSISSLSSINSISPPRAISPPISISSTSLLNQSKVAEKKVSKDNTSGKDILDRSHCESYETIIIPTVVAVKEVKVIKKKRNRCSKNDCNKKLSLMTFTCNCGKKFCNPNHLNPPEEHDCEFDFKQFKRAILKENLPRVTNDKLVRI